MGENIGYSNPISETIPETIPEGQQAVDVGELLLAMRYAIEKMSVQNRNRGLMVTAGSLIIALLTENQELKRQIDLRDNPPSSLILP